MVNIPMNSSAPLTKSTVLSINQQKVRQAENTHTILSINKGYSSSRQPAAPSHSVNTAPTAQASPVQASASPVSMTIPKLCNPMQKGQKFPLENAGRLSKIKVCLGWNVTNSSCDVDVSAFLLNSGGKVIGDTWFVFYGQEISPDASTTFTVDNRNDREIISVDFNRLNSAVSKIVFVLTINEALEKHLNFSMIKDAYIRIINADNNSEIVSFKMDEYYSNVISMMMGELYIHNGMWKFNAVGNGVARDLAGLCELYGVQVV